MYIIQSIQAYEAYKAHKAHILPYYIIHGEGVNFYPPWGGWSTTTLLQYPRNFKAQSKMIQSIIIITISMMSKEYSKVIKLVPHNQSEIC